MAVIPTGSPAWTRTSDFATYGGNLLKRNFASRGVVNPKTDVGAEAFSRMTADLAALARVAPFAVFTILCNDSSVTDPTVEYASMMTGVRASSYAGNVPPTGFPTVLRLSDGHFQITFASSYSDPYGVVGAFSMKHPRAQLTGSAAGSCTATVISATVLDIKAFTSAAAPYANARVCVTIGSGA